MRLKWVTDTVTIYRSGNGWIEPHDDLPLYRAVWRKVLAGRWIGWN